jgi:NAD(P) transhydrogenase subunit alpha
MSATTTIQLFVFLLAGSVGMQTINRIPPLLHTPLMAATNAISGISLVASLVLAGSNDGVLATALGTIAVACAIANIVGGFLITDRMLAMFKRTPTATEAQQERDDASSVAKS